MLSMLPMLMKWLRKKLKKQTVSKWQNTLSRNTAKTKRTAMSHLKAVAPKRKKAVVVFRMVSRVAQKVSLPVLGRAAVLASLLRPENLLAQQKTRVLARLMNLQAAS